MQHKLAKGLLLVGAKLSNAQAVAVPDQHDLYFVSARVSGMDRKDAVATWMVLSLGGSGPGYAVDAAAALVSEFAGAMGKYPDITVDTPGVQKSRICAGGPTVDRGVTAPMPGGGGATS